MPVRVTLPRSTPEEQGVASSAILALLQQVQQQVSDLHSVMLVRHGHVIAEGWWAPYAPTLPHMLFSLSKSFTSTAIGIAVDEGLLSVDDLVLSFFPEEAPATPDANLQAMRVRHLLSMSTGHDQEPPVFSQRNWVRAFLSPPVTHAPGTHFCYNTAATYMLSAIIQKLTGEKLINYLRPRLFQPLGITGARWESCPMGINTGGFGLRIKTEDIARFGQLYLRNGVWNGQRLLSEAWVREATSKQVANGDGPANDWNQGYGYQFWRCQHNCYRGDGAFGQYCLVMPEQDAVLAINSGLGDMQTPLTQVWETLLPAMHAAPLPADPAAVDALTGYLAGLHFDPPAGDAASPRAAQVSGRKIVFAPNDQRIAWAQCDFTDADVTLTFCQGRRTHTVTAGLGDWQFGKNSLLSHDVLQQVAAFRQGPAQSVAASGVWTTPDTFQLTLRYYETPFIMTITSRFTDDGATLQSVVNVDFGPTDGPELAGQFA